MIKIIDALDEYGDMEPGLYYAVQYNEIPSRLDLKLPLKDNKENMERVLELLDIDRLELGVVAKNWKTSDYKDAKDIEDFAFQYLFESKGEPLVIWINLEANALIINFFYQAGHSEVEAWILETNKNFRDTLGETKNPTFKILSKDRHGFYVEKISTKNFKQLDIALSYNDDFEEIDNIIRKAVKEVRSGLILLHGKPGTGKTTYIKNLISIFKETSFIFIQNDFVPQLLSPDFISFLLRHKDCVLIIEDAEKVVISRENQDASVVSTILQLTDGLFSEYLNIKVICSFNTNLEKIDKALLRKGRMIARYEFNELEADKANRLLQTLGHEAMDKAMTVAEAYNLKERQFYETGKRSIGF